MSDIVDKEALLDRVDNDREFLAETVEMFNEDSPEMLAQIRDAAGRGDSDALAGAAHAFKGMVANFCAAEAVEAALKLEMMGRDNDLSAAAAAVDSLAEESRRVGVALEEMLQGDEL